MKINKSWYLLVVSLFTSFVFVIEGNAQCVRCVPAPPGWMCEGSSTPAGAGCITDGGNCTLVETCNPGNNDIAGNGKGCELKTLKKPQVEIPDSLIREVGQVDPHAALALISVRNIKIEYSHLKVNFAAVELTRDDVEKRLTLADYYNSEYFKELNARSQDAFAKRETIIYEVVLNKETDNPSLTITLLSQDKSATSFEINLSKVTEGRGGDASVSYEATSWKNR